MKRINEFIKNEWIFISLIILSFFVGWYISPILPEKVPMHWNFSGEVDKYGSKLWLIIGFPVIALGMYTLMSVLPFIDPKRKNYSLFEGTYKLLRSIILIFFMFIYGVLVLSALGYSLNIEKTVVFGIAILFIILGNYLGRVRQNFFVGIKTPWTLSDSDVWNKTHRLTGKLWVVTGLIIMITIFINSILTFTILIASTFFPLIYSYIIYAKKYK